MKLKPLSDRVLVEKIEKEEKTESGIILPDTTKDESPVQGKVVAIGSGKVNDNGEKITPSVKVGDKILFKQGYGIDEIKIDDKEYLVMKEEDIIGIIQK